MSKHTFGVRFSAGKVDRQAGIIHGVSVIAKGTAKGHGIVVDDTTLAQLEACAREFSGGLKVVASHTKPADSPFAASGFLRNFRRDGENLRADLHVLKSEANREKLFEMAEEIADTFGLSVAFSGADEVINGRTFARCSEIYNAALVDWPAANPTGLFAAGDVDAGAGGTSPDMTQDEIKALVSAAVATQLTEFSGRVRAVEDSLKTFSASADVAALKTQVTGLSAKLDTARKELADGLANDAKRIELAAQTVAMEFSSRIGNGHLPADGAGNRGGAGAGSTEPTGTEKFIACANKHFAATKSKASALQHAISEMPAAYKEFRAANQQIKWAV